jgi:flavin reductase (DIM6/NTAB) family NADH-FMN oxidoreductase RutF
VSPGRPPRLLPAWTSRRRPELTIHTEHPFRDPHPDEVRRLRGRIGAAVSLWTSAGEPPSGLTVSSYVVVAGEQGRIVAAIDPDSDLADRLQESERAVVQLLTWEDRDLADAFAGTMPAPGGAFRMAPFLDTPHGPRLARASTWAGVRLEDAHPLGWSLLVTAVIEDLVVGEGEWLVHRGGRYRRPSG